MGTIDRAFKSRIHLSLYYPKLSKENTIKIWENNLERVRKDFKREGVKFGCDDKDIVKFAKRHYEKLEKAHLLVWNGR